MRRAHSVRVWPVGDRRRSKSKLSICKEKTESWWISLVNRCRLLLQINLSLLYRITPKKCSPEKKVIRSVFVRMGFKLDVFWSSLLRVRPLMEELNCIGLFQCTLHFDGRFQFSTMCPPLWQTAEIYCVIFTAHWRDGNPTMAGEGFSRHCTAIALSWEVHVLFADITCYTCKRCNHLITWRCYGDFDFIFLWTFA